MKFHEDGTAPINNEIFVFGSNLAGRHGAGAAKKAYQNYGAKYGKGIGLCGQSYAIPTKDENIITLDLFTINAYIEDFINFVTQRNDLEFFMTRVGCGLAGFKDKDIAPLFEKLFEKPNISWPNEWKKFVNSNLISV